MSTYKINAAVMNNMGRVRTNNEDNFYLDGVYMQKKAMDKGGLFQKNTSSSAQVYAVCDGMGGEAAGEEASFAAIRSIAQNHSTLCNSNNPAKLTHFVQNLSDLVYLKAQERGARSGTTLAMALIHEQTIRIVHVGDSRIYSMRGNTLKQMTLDHSEVQRMIELGIITKREAKEHPKRHVISQYLGMPTQEVKVEPGISEPIALASGDRYLLCSDGLTDMVNDSDIELLLAKASSASEACAALVKQALKMGGKDNVTIMALFVSKSRPVFQWLCNAMMALFGAGAAVMLIEWIYRLF